MIGWLPWQDATELAGASAAGWAATCRRTRAWARSVRPWAKELTLILLLYALWQFAGAWSLGRASAAMTRGQAIWSAERAIHLPSERAVQAIVLPHTTLLHWLNWYYAAVHVPALGACLVWLFVRHRSVYPRVRTAVALVTGASLVIQLFPVAPPRLLPHLGVVDTGAVVGPSVYRRGAPGLDQLSAMPSLHVGWAVIVAVGVIWASRSQWRWLALAYPVLTMFTVVATGNHYWADGLVATALCAAAVLIVSKAYPKSAPATAPPDHEPQIPAPNPVPGPAALEPVPVRAG
jgi:PAP2 superfamily protein